MADYLASNKLLVFFIGLAVLTRVAFWLYTGRTWEDALITLTHARNAWDGVGLTHHASEPRVHGFTSPIGVLVPLIGESVGQGLAFVKIASLIASIAAIYYAYRIGEALKFHWVGHVMLLSYLATDQLQVFFGMSGMETQIATAVILANAYYLLTSQWLQLGVATGLALLCRPEFIFWVPIVGVVLILVSRKALIQVASVSAIVALPWFAFSLIYYGSPIPHTIVAKSQSFRTGLFSAGWPVTRDYLAQRWANIAPFREFWFAIKTPIPDELLKFVVVLVTGLAIIGAGRALIFKSRMMAIVAFVSVFFIYRTGMNLPTYFMWYLPPFLALYFVLAGYGLSGVARKNATFAAAVGVAISIAYSVHIAFSFPLERKMQVEIEENVRLKTGRILDRLMGPQDTAVLEPLGYIGWAARNKTIYDWPGLGSKVSVDTLKGGTRPSMPALIGALEPTYLVLRPGELAQLERDDRSTADLYTSITRVEAKTGPELSYHGYRYRMSDSQFVILRRATDSH